MTKKEKYGFSSLITVNQSKLDKAQKYGYLSAGIHFAPHTMSGRNVCPGASKGCIDACLTFSGHGGIGLDDNNLNDCQRARIARTKLFFEDPEAFWELFHREMQSFIRKARKRKLRPTFRPNLTSDIVWETKKDTNGQTMFEAYPGLEFMDYTALKGRFRADYVRLRGDNYHLTFSAKEDNWDDAVSRQRILYHDRKPWSGSEDTLRFLLGNGVNVAVVLRVGKDEPFPETYFGAPVIDGDKHDLRFLDKKGCVVGLRPKGVKGLRDTSGFVRDVE